MSKPINEMTDEEIQAEIMRLQSVKIPSQKPPKSPKRLEKEKPAGKRTWRDELFG